MAGGTNDRWWTTHPWRLIQTNLRQIDMADMDAAEYVRQMRSFHATIAMINVGGIIASYHTRVDDHFQSPYLTGDSLERVMGACHDAGIRVIARTDFSKIRRSIYERHPDWAYRTADGSIVDYNGDVHACLNGGYQQGTAKEIIREIVTELPIDGIFFNMGGFVVRDYSYNHYGPCHCDNCRRRFRDETGFTLEQAVGSPRRGDTRGSVRFADEAAARAYELAKRRWVHENEASVYELIRGLRPDVAVDHFEFQRQESNTEIDRALPRWPYDASSNTRWVRSSKPGTISSNTSVDFIGFYYRHVAVNPAQQEIRLWQSLANGGALDYYLIGRLDNHRDRSGFDRIRAVFAYHERNERFYRDLRSEADVLLVRQEHSLSPEGRGWVRLLSEGHYLFDEVVLASLDALELSAYKCVILPAVAAIGDEIAERLDAFVAAGGTLVATGTTGMQTHELEPRDRPVPLSLGIEEVKAIRDDVRSAMFELRPVEGSRTSPGGDDPVASAMPDVDLIYFGDTYVYARYAPGVHGHLRLIPPHTYGPPERCYYEQVSELPGYVVNGSPGGGRAIYLPWLPGALFHREGYVNTSRFVHALLGGIAGVEPLRTNASPMAEITVQRSTSDPDLRLLSIVNLSGHYASTVYDPVPLRDVSVRLALDVRGTSSNTPTDATGKAAVSATSLVDGRSVACETGDGDVTVTLDVEGVCDVVALRG